MIMYNVSSWHRQGLRFDEIEFIEQTIEGWEPGRGSRHAYHELLDDYSPKESSFLGCLHKLATANMLQLVVEDAGDVILARYTGKSSSREQIISGSELKARSIKIRLV